MGMRFIFSLHFKNIFQNGYIFPGHYKNASQRSMCRVGFSSLMASYCVCTLGYKGCTATLYTQIIPHATLKGRPHHLTTGKTAIQTVKSLTTTSEEPSEAGAETHALVATRTEDPVSHNLWPAGLQVACAGEWSHAHSTACGICFPTHILSQFDASTVVHLGTLD